MSTHELQPLVCENCGHDVFIETTTTDERVCGKFALTDDAILLLEPRDATRERGEAWVELTCARCASGVYDTAGENQWRVA